MNYTLKISKKGRDMYYKDNKLCSKDSIPPVVLGNLQPGIPYEYVIEGPKVNDKKCIFCGMHSNLTRMVNGEVVALCEEHFYSESLGRVAQKVREVELAHAA